MSQFWLLFGQLGKAWRPNPFVSSPAVGHIWSPPHFDSVSNISSRSEVPASNDPEVDPLTSSAFVDYVLNDDITALQSYNNSNLSDAFAGYAGLSASSALELDTTEEVEGNAGTPGNAGFVGEQPSSFFINRCFLMFAIFGFVAVSFG